MWISGDRTSDAGESVHATAQVRSKEGRPHRLSLSCARVRFPPIADISRKVTLGRWAERWRMHWVVVLLVLATVVVGYGGAKVIQDMRAKRWAWAAIGLVVTIAVPTVIAIFAQLLAQYLRYGR